MEADEREWGRVVILKFKFWILNQEKNEEANSLKGERGYLARCVTHLAGHVFRIRLTAKAAFLWKETQDFKTEDRR